MDEATRTPKQRRIDGYGEDRDGETAGWETRGMSGSNSTRISRAASCSAVTAYVYGRTVRTWWDIHVKRPRRVCVVARDIDRRGYMGGRCQPRLVTQLRNAKPGARDGGTEKSGRLKQLYAISGCAEGTDGKSGLGKPDANDGHDGRGDCESG